MTTLTPDAERELRELRSRVYGPRADSALDEVELARLQELELQARPAMLRFAPESATAPAETPPTDAAEPETEETAAEHPSPPPEKTGPEPIARVAWWRRRALWLAAAVGLGAGLVLAWGIGAAQSERPDRTLQRSSEEPPPLAQVHWGPEFAIEEGSLVEYERWNSVRVFTATREDGARCLLMSAGLPDETMGVYSELRCVFDGLDPQLDMYVWTGMDEYLGADVPEGSNLRFVARDGVIDVWMQAPRDVSAD